MTSYIFLGALFALTVCIFWIAYQNAEIKNSISKECLTEQQKHYDKVVLSLMKERDLAYEMNDRNVYGADKYIKYQQKQLDDCVAFSNNLMDSLMNTEAELAKTTVTCSELMAKVESLERLTPVNKLCDESFDPDMFYCESCEHNYELPESETCRNCRRLWDDGEQDNYEPIGDKYYSTRQSEDDPCRHCLHAEEAADEFPCSVCSRFWGPEHEDKFEPDDE